MRFFFVVLVCFLWSMDVGAEKLTPGYLVVARTDRIIADATIYQNGINLGIGTTNPRGALDVVDGSVYASAFIGSGAGLTDLPLGMVYPSSGVPSSTGSAWSTSYSTSGSGTAIALTTSPVFTTPNIGSATGSITGNAGTATALASNPTDCGVNNWATTIDSSGNLTCAPVTYAGISAMTSANMAGILSNETGTGLIVFNDSPSFAGNVGIGSVSPRSVLDVNGTINATQFVGGGAGITGIGGSISGLTPGKLTKAGTTTTIIDSAIYESGGNVGIGTTAPTSVLDVGGVVKATGGSSTDWNTAYTDRLKWDGGSTGLTASTGRTSLGLGSAYDLNKGAMTDSKYCTYASGTTAIVCNSEGGGASISSANPTATIALTAVNGSAGTFMRSDASPALGVGISPTWTGNHTFSPSSGNTLFSSGNVGIGTATPRSALDVSGEIYGTGTIYTTGKISSYGSATRSFATRTVCSSQAVNKVNCDYVCDGTDDEVQINQAILSLPQVSRTTGGDAGLVSYIGKIHLSTGLFSIGHPVVLKEPEFIWLEGEGGDNTYLYLANNANCDLIQTDVSSHAGTAFNVIITDILLSGNKENQSGAGGYGYYDGIGATHVEDSVFDRVFIYNTKKAGIKLNGAYTFKFHSSIVEATGAEGVVVSTGNDLGFQDSKFILNLGNAIDVAESTFLRVVNNNIDAWGNNTCGINLGANSNYGVIANNTIEGHLNLSSGNATGICVAGDRNIISSNTIAGSDVYMTSGIKVVSGADNNQGWGNVVVLAAGTAPYSDAGTNNRIEIDGVLYGSVSYSPEATGAIKFGTATNYGGFDTDGDLLFTGTADYLVGADDYAFRYSGDEDAGLYFNSAGSVDVKDLSGVSVVKFGLTGEIAATGFSGDGTGKITCIKADGNLGTCRATTITTSGCTCD